MKHLSTGLTRGLTGDHFIRYQTTKQSDSYMPLFNAYICFCNDYLKGSACLMCPRAQADDSLVWRWAVLEQGTVSEHFSLLCKEGEFIRCWRRHFSSERLRGLYLYVPVKQSCLLSCPLQSRNAVYLNLYTQGLLALVVIGSRRSRMSVLNCDG